MKNIIKAFLGIMFISLVLVTFSACELMNILSVTPTVPDECEHTGGEATCTEAALCELCGESYGEALGHDEESIPGKSATCTEAGLSKGKKCSVCGEVLVAQEDVPAKGHTEVTNAAIEADCTQPGLTEGKYCSACGEILVAQETISAKGHVDENDDFVCDACESELCTEHSPAEAVRENEIVPDCTADGSYDLVVYCALCGDEISRENKVSDKLSHTEEILAGKAPSCTETGLTEGKKCSVCGETLVEQQELSIIAHTEEVVPGKAATCTEAGITDGKKCSVCGETLAAQEEIPAGHNFVDGICTGCGYITNVFAGKQFVGTSDAAANIYSSGFGYQTLTDGIIYEEGTGRFSSKQNGGLVEGIIDLGAVYDLSELKVYLYWGGLNKLGTGFEIQVLFGGEWTTVVDCATLEDMEKYWVDNPDSVDKDWLVFDLGGVSARQLKFTIPGQTDAGWTTLYEIECSGKVSTKVEPEPEEPVLIENVFSGKQFTPTAEAEASVLVKSWWQGGGYETLTDGIKTADNAPGRFSTVMATTGFMDATIDLGGTYELHSLKFYIYEVSARTEAQIKSSIGTDILIQVYANGEWTDVIICADNETLYTYLVSIDGVNNDYLEFNLNGIEAEKVRFYISASASASGTTYQEIECNGYAK